MMLLKVGGNGEDFGMITVTVFEGPIFFYHSTLRFGASSAQLVVFLQCLQNYILPLLYLS